MAFIKIILCTLALLNSTHAAFLNDKPQNKLPELITKQSVKNLRYILSEKNYTYFQNIWRNGVYMV